MIKLNLGRGKPAPAAENATEGAEPSTAPGTRKRQPSELRVQKELDELELPPATTINFPDKDVLMKFDVMIQPDEGYWKGAKYSFSFTIPPGYPHEPPKVKCETKVYHPNIDLKGNICLNILREDWKPVLSINSVVYGLLYLFLEPNPGDPLNHEAAQALRDNKAEFKRLVERSLKGMTVAGETFPKLL
eukprot:GDKH01001698.1.p1 GENE.GDKH01001698.1~~GDKH01001698.1.p1  ORF type:complete len:189 (+),score=21.20 GDKH01001698.1:94-660(+)